MQLRAITFANKAAFNRLDKLPPHIPMEVAAMALEYGLDVPFEELQRTADCTPCDDFGLIPAGDDCGIDPEVLADQLGDLAERFGWQTTTGDLFLRDDLHRDDDDDDEEEDTSTDTEEFDDNEELDDFEDTNDELDDEEIDEDDSFADDDWDEDDDDDLDDDDFDDEDSDLGNAP